MWKNLHRVILGLLCLKSGSCFFKFLQSNTILYIIYIFNIHSLFFSTQVDSVVTNIFFCSRMLKIVHIVFSSFFRSTFISVKEVLAQVTDIVPYSENNRLAEQLCRYPRTY